MHIAISITTTCMHGVFSYLFRHCRIEKTWGTTCGKADHVSMAAILGPGGPYMAAKFAVDGPGDQLRCDSSLHTTRGAVSVNFGKLYSSA